MRETRPQEGPANGRSPSRREEAVRNEVITRTSVLIAAALAMPIATLAQQHAAPPASRPAPPPAAGYHPAAVARAAPVSRAPVFHSASAYLTSPVFYQRTADPWSAFYPPSVSPASTHPAAAHSVTVPYAPLYQSWHGPVLYNPYHWARWGWNHGVVWYPIHIYWGGGFWGPWGLSMNNALQYGAVADSQDRAIYPSYDVYSGSPGAQLLADYGLQQTDCGPPNLVVIWGPDNSVICAYPNDLVPAGNYELDPATFTLQSL
jgi:hypothetical protein